MKEAGENASLIPRWLRRPVADRVSRGPARRSVRGLHTVCEEARCPNRGDCLGKQATATFLILGPGCTRDCGFCAVSRALRPPDPTEPARVARAAAELGLRYVVITSPSRDDLPDGGASAFAETVGAVRAALPGAGVEVLVGDLGGANASLDTVIGAGPTVFAHNIETVRRLYPKVRPGADYERSLSVLEYAAARGVPVKSALIVGMGETYEEVCGTISDLADAGVSVLTVGQYMRPSPAHIPVARYITPEEFSRIEERARAAGIASAVAGPYVRSSYRAAELAARVLSDVKS